MTDPAIPLELAHRVVTLAQEAGEAILRVYSQADVGTTLKDDQSPLTLADMQSHRHITAGLEQLASYPVLSEESKAVAPQTRRQWGRFWLVDPLDGTKEFIKRNGEFTVNIALIEAGRAVFGVVHAPALGVTYYGLVGHGAFKRQGGEERAVHVAPYRSGPLKLVASRSHAGAETDAFVASLRGAYEGLERLAIGSALKLCLVAAGNAQLYPRFGPTMEWDTAAAQCIVEQAGGSVTDLYNEPLAYNKDALTNPFFVVSSGGVSWSAHLPSSLLEP